MFLIGEILPLNASLIIIKINALSVENKDLENEKLKTEIKDTKSKRNLEIIKYTITIVGAVSFFYLITMQESFLKKDISLSDKRREDIKIWLQYGTDADSAKRNMALTIIKAGMSSKDDKVSDSINIAIIRLEAERKYINAVNATTTTINDKDEKIKRLEDSLNKCLKIKTIGSSKRKDTATPYNLQPNVITLNEDNDRMGVIGNVFDGFRTAYMKRDPNLNNMWTMDGGGAFHVGWTFNVPNPGKYRLRVRYASIESRPMDIMVNDIKVGQAFKNTTNSNNIPEWRDEGIIDLSSGMNRLWFYSDKLTPNIKAVELEKI